MIIEQVGADAWKSWIEQHEGLLLDVREPFEWQQTGVLPEAKLISMGELPASLNQLSKDVPILVVCRTGSRSQHAAQWLEAHGYQAANLSGGVVAVARATPAP